jgi:signal transduction histidine kinase
MLGSDRQRLIGWPFRLHIAPHGRRAFLDHMHRSRRDTGQIHSELPLRVTRELDIPIELISRRSTIAHAGITFRAALFDLRERKRAEHELEQAAQLERMRIVEAEQRSAQLRTLSAALFRVEADERRELATLLHDDLGQRLIAVRLRLAALARDRPHDFTPVLAILDDAHQAVRSLSFQLSPPILHELGLVPALRWLAGEMLARYGLHVEFTAADEVPPLSSEARYLLFRSARELLLNVVKHADTDRAWLTIRTLATGLELSVTDHGRGFDPGQGSAPHSNSFGLLSLSERVHARDGHLTIVSQRQQGTRVLLVLPWESPDPAA